MEAVISGMAMIQSGMAHIILAGGTEHMSSIPYSVPGARWGCRLQDHDPCSSLRLRSHSPPGGRPCQRGYALRSL
jgi:acetyl-CoA acetyltransferase